MIVWPDFGATIDQIVAGSSTTFDLEVIAVSKELASFLRGRCTAPGVRKGHWNTIIFDWGSSPEGFEIEVFSDHLELYRSPAGRIDIEYFPHRRGESFPDELVTKMLMHSPR